MQILLMLVTVVFEIGGNYHLLADCLIVVKCEVRSSAEGTEVKESGQNMRMRGKNNNNHFRN